MPLTQFQFPSKKNKEKTKSGFPTMGSRFFLIGADCFREAPMLVVSKLIF
jgi:hypothetical protein